ncbi:MAG: TerB family tellurite resistance protein [Alphaproteobacteria bacterium]|nr:TerB family tellurite resistance protein [Alphaproteobacteria bacterium]
MAQTALTSSQFYMWRTLFAIAHADGVVSEEEVRFMAEALEDFPFSKTQRAILNEDVKHAQGIEVMFQGITDARDLAAFFKYARILVHIDGEFSESEQKIMQRLQEMRFKHADFDSLIGGADLDLELEDERDVSNSASSSVRAKTNLQYAFDNFRNYFMKSFRS